MDPFWLGVLCTLGSIALGALLVIGIRFVVRVVLALIALAKYG